MAVELRQQPISIKIVGIENNVDAGGLEVDDQIGEGIVGFELERS